MLDIKFLRENPDIVKQSQICQIIQARMEQIFTMVKAAIVKNTNEAIAKIDEYTNDQTIDNLIRLCIYLINMQIYTDGNSRTIFEFLYSIN